MSGVDVVALPVAAHQCTEHGRVLLGFGTSAEEAVDTIEHALEVSGIVGSGQEGALQQRRQKRGTNAFARNVGDDNGPAVGRYGQNVVIIAADLMGCFAAASRLKPSRYRQRLRQ